MCVCRQLSTKLSISILCCKFKGVKINRATCPFVQSRLFPNGLTYLHETYLNCAHFHGVCCFLFYHSEINQCSTNSYFHANIFWPLRPSSVTTILIYNRLRLDIPINISVWYASFVRKQLQKRQQDAHKLLLFFYVC